MHYNEATVITRIELVFLALLLSARVGMREVFSYFTDNPQSD